MTKITDESLLFFYFDLIALEAQDRYSEAIYDLRLRCTGTELDWL